MAQNKIRWLLPDISSRALLPRRFVNRSRSRRLVPDVRIGIPTAVAQQAERSRGFLSASCELPESLRNGSPRTHFVRRGASTLPRMGDAYRTCTVNYAAVLASPRNSRA